MIVIGIQPVSSILFTAIGKSYKGILLAMTRQVILLIPLLIVLPVYFGIDGVLYAGPIADGIAAAVAFIFIYREFKKLTEMENEEKSKRGQPAAAV